MYLGIISVPDVEEEEQREGEDGSEERVQRDVVDPEMGASSGFQFQQ